MRIWVDGETKGENANYYPSKLSPNLNFAKSKILADISFANICCRTVCAND